jgi:hypothetical protein
MKGIRLGKCERWILLEAPNPDEEPRWITQGYEGRYPHYEQWPQIVNRAIKKLAGIGLIEVHKKYFGNDEVINDCFFDVNHGFWCNHIRLTPKGKAVVDAARTELEESKPIRWNKTLKVMEATLTFNERRKSWKEYRPRCLIGGNDDR